MTYCVRKRLAALCLCGVLASASLGGIKAVRKRARNMEVPPPPAHAADKQEQRSECERLLVKYLTHIDEIVREREARQVQWYKEKLEGWRKAGEELIGKESEILERLRSLHKRKRRKLLDSEGPCDEMRQVVPTCAASARIFTALCKEGAVKVSSLVSLFHANAEALDKEWVPLLQDIAQNSDKGSRVWRWSTMTLYKAGVSRDKYRPAMVEMATQDGDIVALDALFFDVDSQTGQPRKILSLQNLALMKKLGNKGFPPEMRVTCAYYAADVRDYDLAQGICVDLLSRQYKGFEDTNAPPPEEDGPLYRARHAAMGLMFFGLRNERMFKQIYDRSQIIHTELRDNATKPPGTWISFGSYVVGRMEVNHAQSLIGELELFGGQDRE